MSALASGVRRVDVASVFAALGEATRLRLVTRLSDDGPLSIARLSDGAGVTRQAVTKHLKALAHAGVVRGTRRGRERIWELRPKRLEMASRYLDEVSGQWDAAIERLRAFLEDKS
ncbi:MAG: ArsR/SmtB family transcription factor [Longimicrobiales bacterium]